MSVVTSLLVHGTLIAAAPWMAILRPASEPPGVLKRFQVNLLEPTTRPSPAEPTAERSFPSKPTPVEDLLARGPQTLEEVDSLMDEVVDIPGLDERIASEIIPRDRDLPATESALRRIDARIVEISEEKARKDIEIARRYVRPSSDRILEKGEYPVLRDVLGEAAEDVLLIQPFRSKRAPQLGQPPTMGHVEEIRESDEADIGTGKPEPALPELPIEEVVARAPVIEEIRRESAYEFIDDLVDIDLDAVVPPGTESGFFRLRIVPKEGEDIELLPKDVTFVVDASRSIPQHKLNRTVAGLKHTIAMLRPEDHFNIVVFRDSATRFRPQRVPATPDNQAAGLDFLSGLQSRGETDVYKAIRPVVLSQPRDGVPSVVVVVTDGRPTAGLVDARTIINALTADNAPRNTIFAYGGGKTVNRYLLDLLAYRNKGESHVTRNLSDINEELPTFLATLNDPILVDCKVDYGAINDADVFPKEVPDFYRGRAVTIYGRFDPGSDAEFTIRLTGTAGERKKEVIFKARLGEAATGSHEIAQNWAFGKIYYLIGEICRVGETPELVRELRELSRQYGIRTSYDK